MMGLAFIGLLIALAGFLIPKSNADTETEIALRKAAKGIGLFVAIVATAWAAFYIVPAGERGILLQFGAVQGVLGEGPHFVMPYVQQVERIEVRTQRVDTENASAASKDLQIVHASVAVNYHVDPQSVGEIWKKLGRNYQQRVVDPAVTESLKAVTAQYTAEELVKLRETVKGQVQNQITERLRPYNILVEPNGVSITNFDFSAQFNEAIEQKQVSQQKAEQQKYILAQAKLQAETMVTEAKGRAEAARINAQALQQQGGEKLLMREWIEAWKAGGSQVPTIVGGGQNMFMLDLKQLQSWKAP